MNKIYCMLKFDERAIIEKQPMNVRTLYDRYADMLLGYVFEIVKDRKVAEDYLVRIFSDILEQINDKNWNGINNWSQLQQFAKNKLSVFADTVEDGEPGSINGLVEHTSNEYLERMNYDQRKVFCDVYYNRKKIAEISIELNRTEDSIRKTLKEAFAIMRNDSEN